LKNKNHKASSSNLIIKVQGMRKRFYDEDQPNTKLNYTKDLLEMPNRPNTSIRAKKLKEALNEFVRNI
jgi:hypothetical protein